MTRLEGDSRRGPHVVVLSSLFPSASQPGAGLFVRERMFRVASHLPLCVVAPTPWFPLQRILRRWRPGFRPGAPAYESQQGIDVWFPRFLSVPGLFKRFDGVLLALCALPRLVRLRRAGRLDVIDAHFAYPDGYAAGLLGRWLNVPVTVTMRGTEPRHCGDAVLAPRVTAALNNASRVFAVSASLRRLAIRLGIEPAKVDVVGNGIDVDKFFPVPRELARQSLGLPTNARVIITVGALVERKGFHRVIDLLPALRRKHPALHYVVVGGSSPEGDMSGELRRQVQRLSLSDVVHFLGALPSDRLRVAMSAADLFVLATSNEGWANVLLESLACGVPVVATDVGGNAEVLSQSTVGSVVPYGDAQALYRAIDAALDAKWDAHDIRSFAEQHGWQRPVDHLVKVFGTLARCDLSPGIDADPAPCTKCTSTSDPC
jgi:teichuronic acid biosynthesis glycosyltransferase TuaC